MEQHADRISRLIGKNVKFIPDICGEKALSSIKQMKVGEIIFLDNIRMHDDEKFL